MEINLDKFTLNGFALSQKGVSQPMGPTGEQRPALSLLLSQNLTRFKGPLAVCRDRMLSMTMAFEKGPSTFYPPLTQFEGGKGRKP